ncbi:hypothetical protein T484DRAFT_1808064, partial [Baffinella frigidus]
LLEDFPDPPPAFPDKFKGVEKQFQPPFTWIFLGPHGAFSPHHKQFQPPFTWIFLGPQGAFSPLHRDIWFTCACTHTPRE